MRSALEYKTASYIPNWSYDGDVPKFVSTYHPDLVLITLGANEIEIPKPEMRAGPIKHLVGELGGRPCVWVAPPLWKPDTGLLKVIKDNIAPCRYLDSNALVHDLPRGRDKIHPNPEGREIWAKIVFDWLSKRTRRQRQTSLGVEARARGKLTRLVLPEGERSGAGAAHRKLAQEQAATAAHE